MKRPTSIRRSNPTHRARLRSRASERGASVLVVMLVLTLLLGIGLFAASSATQSARVSGNMRQWWSTRHVTEGAMNASLAQMATNSSGYMQRIAQDDAAATKERCPGLENKLNATCYAFRAPDVGVIVPPPDLATGKPGGLGMGDLTVDFNVAASEVRPVSEPIPGYMLNEGAVDLIFLGVTFTARAQVRPNQGAAQSGFEALGAAEVWRAHARIGPTKLPTAKKK